MSLPNLWEFRSQQEGPVAAQVAQELLLWCEGALQSCPVKPFCFLEVEGARSLLFAPSFPFVLRQAIEQGNLMWVKVPAALAAKTTSTFLESALCSGVCLRGEAGFSRATPASLWSRRWRLSADKGQTPFLWWHSIDHPALFSFDVRVDWNTSGERKIRKGASRLFGVQCTTKAS